MNAEDAQLLKTFRDDAADYCALIDDLRAGRADEPYAQLLRLLSKLAMSSHDLPIVCAENREGDAPTDQEPSAGVSWEIDAVTREARDELEALYDGNEEGKARAFLLFTDLGELYDDLREGLALYERGGCRNAAEAAWQWRFGYECHWAAHLFRALRTVHDIRYYLRRA